MEVNDFDRILKNKLYKLYCRVYFNITVNTYHYYNQIAWASSKWNICDQLGCIGEQLRKQRPATSILNESFTVKKYYTYDTFGKTEEFGDSNFVNFIGFTDAVNEGSDI